MRFECHDRVEDEYISTDILASADKTYEYLTSLPDKKRFIQPITRAISAMTEARSYSPVDFVRAFPSGKTDDLVFIREGDLPTR